MPYTLCVQANGTLPKGNLPYREGVLFVTYSLLIQRGKGGAVVGRYGLDGNIEYDSADDADDDSAAAAAYSGTLATLFLLCKNHMPFSKFEHPGPHLCPARVEFRVVGR